MPLAHAQPAVLALVIGTGIARHLTNNRTVTLAFYVVMVAALLAFAAEGYHEHRLCTRCAAATGGPATAARHHRWLRLHHWATQRFTYALILLGGPLVAFGLGLPHWAGYPVFAAWVLVALANLRHRPVQPWCPHCQGWS